MSTFDGVIKEYPLISIDCFMKKTGNFESTTYFLSHCHKDHMKGLKGWPFYYLLEKRPFSKIYLSDVSSHLLRNDYEYQHLSNYLEVLPMEEPTVIVLYNKDGTVNSRVVVTLLTAGHCLGSVMFFIEGDNGNVLYTGDFRLPVGSSARLTNMHEKNGSIKPLKSLYIDTTFCNSRCLYIPSREECLNAIVSVAEPWLFEGPNHIVFISCPYEYGYEFVFVELYKRFGVKTHVKEEKRRMYVGIKEIEDAVTSCASDARIHACALDNENRFTEPSYPHAAPCGFISSDQNPVKVKKIKPSAMFFQTNNFMDISWVDKDNFGKEVTRVCYSTHPSLSEIQDMVNYLKPEQVFPNVVAGQTVEHILFLIHGPLESEDSSISPLGKLKNPLVHDFSSYENDSLPFFDECYEISKDEKNERNFFKNKSHTLEAKENISVDTDFESTGEQEPMLNQELYLQKKKAVNSLASPLKSPLQWHNPIISSDEEIALEAKENISVDTDFESTKEQESMLKHELNLQKIKAVNGLTSPLQWHNPIISSDEEVFGNSSLDSSLKDKGDSDVICGTSDDIVPKSSYEEENRNISPFVSLQKNSLGEHEVTSPSQSLICENYIKHNYGSHQTVTSDSKTFHSGVKNSEIERGNMKESYFMKEYNEKVKLEELPFNTFSSNERNGNTDSGLKSLNLIPTISLVHNDLTVSKDLTNQSKKLNEHNAYDNVQMPLSGVTADKELSVRNRNMSELKTVDDIKMSFGGIISDKISMTKANGSSVTKKHRSRSFNFIKKLNDSSDSEDEYSFKFVVKLPPKNKSINCMNTKLPNLDMNQFNSNNSINNICMERESSRLLDFSESEAELNVTSNNNFLKDKFDGTKNGDDNEIKCFSSGYPDEDESCSKTVYKSVVLTNSNCLENEYEYKFETSNVNDEIAKSKLKIQAYSQSQESVSRDSALKLDSDKPLQVSNIIQEPVCKKVNVLCSYPSRTTSKNAVSEPNSCKDLEDQNVIQGPECRKDSSLISFPPGTASKEAVSEQIIDLSLANKNITQEAVNKNNSAVSEQVIDLSLANKNITQEAVNKNNSAVSEPNSCKDLEDQNVIQGPECRKGSSLISFPSGTASKEAVSEQVVDLSLANKNITQEAVNKNNSKILLSSESILKNSTLFSDSHSTIKNPSNIQDLQYKNHNPYLSFPPKADTNREVSGLNNSLGNQNIVHGIIKENVNSLQYFPSFQSQTFMPIDEEQNLIKICDDRLLQTVEVKNADIKVVDLSSDDSNDQISITGQLITGKDKQSDAGKDKPSVIKFAKPLETGKSKTLSCVVDVSDDSNDEVSIISEAVTEKKKVQFDVVDILSDDSNEEVFIINEPLVGRGKVLSDVQNLHAPSTSCVQNFSCSMLSLNSSTVISDCKSKFENLFMNLKRTSAVREEGLPSVIKNRHKIQRTSMEHKSVCKLIEGSKRKDYGQPNNSSEKSIYCAESSKQSRTETPVHNNIANNAYKELNTLSQTNAEENICSVWEIKSVSHTSSSSIIVEDVRNSSSDLEDSPSIIAPLITVPKVSHNDNSTFLNICSSNKKRSTEHEGAIASNNSEHRYNSSNENCDIYLKNSDSTPEDLIGHSSSFLSSELPVLD